VDVLRALAALAVLFHHIPPYHFPSLDEPFDFRTLALLPLKLGHPGVPLFLVLSGFCIHLTTAGRIARKQDIPFDWCRFWQRRIFRLYPPYLVAILWSLGVYAIVRQMGRLEAIPQIQRLGAMPWDLLTHLLLVHNLFQDYCFRLGNGPFWTLGLEEQLYALYAVLLFLRFRCSWKHTMGWILAVNLVWMAIVTVGPFCPDPIGTFFREKVYKGPLAPGQFAFWPFAFWFCWSLGAWAAEAHQKAIRLPKFCYSYGVSIAVVVLALLLDREILGKNLHRLLGVGVHPDTIAQFVLLTSMIEKTLFGIAFFIILNRWVAAETAGNFSSAWARVLCPIGIMSYSLYLIHYPLLHLAEACFRWDESFSGLLLRFTLYPPAILALSGLFFLGVERHFLRRPPRPAAEASNAEPSKPPLVFDVVLAGRGRSDRLFPQILADAEHRASCDDRERK
jgi:peptidoglycan/LPS O-acetylase OafA/YrhL